MSNPNKPSSDPKKLTAAQQKLQAAASRETKRPSDSVPLVVGPFASLPAKFGRYDVEKLLGRGAMGSVYLANDTQLNRRVALKIPKVSASGSKRLLARLETEAKAAAQLDHPSLCKVYDAGEIGGQCFIAMKYIEGETLKSQLESKGKTVPEAITLILQLAEGLTEAHNLQIVHRDLKPENILIDRRGVPVIMDFGLAKFSTLTGNAAATQAGTILGSPAYMSPEQASGNVSEIDHRSDIYSLGVILFELLTGKLPFEGSAMQILGQKSILEPASPLSLKSDLPPALSAVCHKMIARTNATRYQNLAEVIADLDDVVLHLVELEPGAQTSRPEPSAQPFPDVVASYHAEVEITSKRKKGTVPESAGTSNAKPLTKPQQLIARWKSIPSRRKWIAAGGAGVLLLCGLIIVITSRDGTRIDDATGAKVTIRIDDTDGEEGGQRHIPTSGASIPSAETNSSRSATGWQGWPVDAPPPAIAPFETNQAKAHQEAWASYLKTPVEYTNSIGMTFRLIPPGEFTMGSPISEIGRAGDESQVTVRLTQPIQVGTTEVTQAQWQEVMSTQPWRSKPDVKDGPDYPATYVSWADAEDFCAKLSDKLDTKYRLLTEAEWEYACRAGTTTRYGFGDDDSKLGLFAWFDENTRNIQEPYAHQVRLKQPNQFGLHDMHGNVREWCRDWYAQSLPGGTNPLVSSSDLGWVRRGGSWFSTDVRCRSADRLWSAPGDRRGYLGFRVARTLTSPTGRSISVKIPSN